MAEQIPHLINKYRSLFATLVKGINSGKLTEDARARVVKDMAKIVSRLWRIERAILGKKSVDKIIRFMEKHLDDIPRPEVTWFGHLRAELRVLVNSNLRTSMGKAAIQETYSFATGGIPHLVATDLFFTKMRLLHEFNQAVAVYHRKWIGKPQTYFRFVNALEWTTLKETKSEFLLQLFHRDQIIPAVEASAREWRLVKRKTTAQLHAYYISLGGTGGFARVIYFKTKHKPTSTMLTRIGAREAKFNHLTPSELVDSRAA